MKPISLSVDNGAMFVLCDDGKIYRRDSMSNRWQEIAMFLPPEPDRPFLKAVPRKKAKAA